MRAAWFCEQCGTNREQLGDEYLAPIRECPSCHQAACPNCWNVVASSCLRCVPFSLPIVDVPPPPEPTLAGAIAAATSVVPEPAAGKTDRIRRRLAKVVPTVPAVESPLPAMVLAPPVPPVSTTAPQDHTPAPAAAPATPAAAADPAKPGRRPKRAAKAAAASAAAATPEVQWPDRSVEWERGPGAHPVEPWPTRGELAAPAAPSPRPASMPRPAGRSGVSRGRAASLAGFTVVVVALFGVAGLTLTALGRLPDSSDTSGRPATPAATEPGTIPDGGATTPADAMPTDAAPPLVRNGSKDQDVAGDGGGGGTTPGGGGRRRWGA